LFRPSDIAKLGKKKPMEEDSSIGVKYLKVLRKVLLFQSISLKVFGRFSASFESFLKVFKALAFSWEKGIKKVDALKHPLSGSIIRT
jgi:hypothetical protein